MFPYYKRILFCVEILDMVGLNKDINIQFRWVDFFAKQNTTQETLLSQVRVIYCQCRAESFLRKNDKTISKVHIT